jgi:hypothetical protein
MSTPTPAKKRKTAASAPVPTGSESNERVEFRKVCQELARTRQSFIDACNWAQEFEESSLENLNLLITEKKAELAELAAHFSNEKKNAEIKLAQEIAEHKYQAVLGILATRSEVAIVKGELDDLRARCANAAQHLETELGKLRDSEKAAAHAQLGAALKARDLEHKASTAELAAKVSQQEREIASLNAQIQNLLVQIEKQRELTKSVADAGRQGAINQTIGKT